MKKIYYAFVLVLMALTSMNAMADISIKLYCCPLKSFLIDMPFFWSGQKVKG